MHYKCIVFLKQNGFRLRLKIDPKIDQVEEPNE